MHDTGIGYGSVNHPVDRDPVCGFAGIIKGNRCPSCGRIEDDVLFERLRRITGYLVGSLERWNDGKKAEEAARVKHNVSADDCKSEHISCDKSSAHKNGVYTKSEKAAREAKKASAKKALGKA